ncbi:MAG: PKD domain-containing protein, partial [Bacteroidota bacterium]
FTAPSVSEDKKYRVVLTVNDGEADSEPDTVIVTVKNVLQPPVAHAGKDIVVQEGNTGQLNGESSSDPEGLDLDYSWEIIPNDFIADAPQAAVTDFTAPEVSADTQYKAVLTVTNSAGLTDKDTAEITVKNEIEPPVADAGPDFATDENTENNQLDGTSSWDPQNLKLSYNWNDLDKLGLTGATSSKPSFTSPEVNKDTDFRVELIVDNGTLTSEPDTVVVTVRQVNKPPVADAGEDQTVKSGDNVILNGENSTDPDGDPLSYNWTAPEAVILSDETSVAPEFIAPETEGEQDFNFILTVTDNSGLQSSSSVTITVIGNRAPVVSTSLNVTVNEKEQLRLDASESHDPDGDELGFRWSAFVAHQEHLVTFDDELSATPVFTAPEVEADQTLKIYLEVSDGKETSTAIIEIHIVNVNTKPVARAGDDITVVEGETAVLNGTGSSDADGDNLTYYWFSEKLMIEQSTSATPAFTAPATNADVLVWATLIVSDGQIESEPDTVWITVQQANQPPVFEDIPNEIAEIGKAYYALITVSDPDENDELVVFSNDLPYWLTLTDNGDGTAVLTAEEVPQEEDLLGTHSILLQVSDGKVITKANYDLTITLQTGTGNKILPAVTIYPNPTRAFVNVVFQEIPEPGTVIKVFDQNAKTILNRQAGKKQVALDLSSLPGGIYYIGIYSENIIRSEKIVVQ